MPVRMDRFLRTAPFSFVPCERLHCEHQSFDIASRKVLPDKPELLSIRQELRSNQVRLMGPSRPVCILDLLTRKEARDDD